ncbi:FadR family transcriptional regulator [Treponema primitia]|uniref:FadR/GntR family transcriptional regulator n=1 Tax=Treponema primitia TaxID=88058 RepID=UPI003981017B
MHTIEKLKTESLRTQVYAKLKEQLLRGVWKEGEKLPAEHALGTLFGVSRVTIRAALQQLEILGLVETKQGGGTFVKKFSAIETVDSRHPLIQIQKNQDLISVMEYRKIIEKGTIGLAQEKISPEDITFLEETYTTMKNPRNEEEYIEADLAFHYRLAQITRNSLIIKVHELINVILSTAMIDIVHMVGKSIGPAWHRKIIDALKKGDKAVSEALMEAHIEENITAIGKKENPEDNPEAHSLLP